VLLRGSRLSSKRRFTTVCGEECARAKKRTVGNPFDKNTAGTASGSRQFQQVMSYIDAGKKERPSVTGGNRVGDKGYFIEPTVFATCKTT